MEKTLLSSDLYSHPGRLLEDHLTSVANLAGIFFKDKHIADHENLKTISMIIGLSHDLGKATTFFQTYLLAENSEKKKLKNRPETSHGLFSAVCAFYLVKEYLKQSGSDGNSYYPLFAFEVVKRHHGDLRYLIDETIINEEDKRLLDKQLDNIDTKKFDILAQLLFEAGLPIILTKEISSQWISSIKKELRTYKRFIRNSSGEASNYLIINLLYSILLDADKSDVVIGREGCFERLPFKDIPQNIVNIYKSHQPFQNSPINPLRESAYKEVLSHRIDFTKKLYSINLPTGLGKTIISLAFGLKLRNQIRAETQDRFVPRIVYALPFLSIIEQNTEVFKDILNAGGVSPHNNILLKHHHLSEVFYRNKDEEFESEMAKILIEGWNSEIIVTTFVQLFHTLISNKNKSLRKFHRLNNSIIILDEVQSIPIKYWLLIKMILQLLTEKLNLYVVFVTATEPLIFERKELVRLVESKKYFKKMNRVTIKSLLDEDMTLTELYESFNMNSKRYLFIFNTISSAKKFYEMIHSEHKDISFLSTHIVPKERLLRIEDIKRGKYRIVVTTQLVEAGVDIDFDVVVRDIAPLDSINQAAGRCNRNDLIHNNKGTVYVVSLKDDNGRRFSSYIYDPVLLDITRNILDKYQEIEESRFLEIINEYYIETSKKKAQKESKDVIEAISRLRYDSPDAETTAISDFRLIDKDYSKKDVFVEIDDAAKQVWNRYMELREFKDIFKRKKEFDTIKADFYQYMISIPANIENVPPQIGELCYVSNADLSEYYDLKTGFITKDDRSLIIW